MWFVLLGVLLVGLKFWEVGMVAAWNWWVVLVPFAAAAAWWAYADASGLTKRREMNKLEERKTQRRQKSLAALGIGRDRQGGDDAVTRARRAAAERAEAERSTKRQHNEQVIKDSVFDSRMQSGLEEPDPKGPEKP